MHMNRNICAILCAIMQQPLSAYFGYESVVGKRKGSNSEDNMASDHTSWTFIARKYCFA